MKWPWKSSAPSPETLALWQEALSIPLFSPLSAEERHSLLLLADRFLQQKKLVALQGLVLNDVMEARVALLFSLPVLGLGLDWLDGFNEILIYPSPFVVGNDGQDDTGLAYRSDMVHSGQRWDQGPIVLNWQEIQDSFDLSGFNLIIHETAHKLDGRNTGLVNGTPLVSLREVAHWENLLRSAMEDLQDEVDLVGEDAASMDAYAASDPAECFAVLSEYFFSSTELFSDRFPELYRCFVQFYRQDPLARLNAQRSTQSAPPGDMAATE